MHSCTPCGTSTRRPSFALQRLPTSTQPTATGGPRASPASCARACVRATCALRHVHACARMDVLHCVQYAHFCTGRDTAVMKVIRSPGRSQLMLQCLIGTCRADVNKLDRLGCARPPARPHCPEQSTPSTFANHVPSAQSGVCHRAQAHARTHAPQWHHDGSATPATATTHLSSRLPHRFSTSTFDFSTTRAAPRTASGFYAGTRRCLWPRGKSSARSRCR
jgi:hypothetical protein